MMEDLLMIPAWEARGIADLYQMFRAVMPEEAIPVAASWQPGRIRSLSFSAVRILGYQQKLFSTKAWVTCL